MKCKIFTLKTLLILFLFIPFVVNAKESCTIVSGNGRKIGSEIACGSEHFYVIDSDDTSIKMLAKYNLLVGDSINKIVLSQERWDELFAEYGTVNWDDSIYISSGIFAEPEFDGEFQFFYYRFSPYSREDRSINTQKHANTEYKKIIVSEERYNELDARYNFGPNGAINSFVINEPEFEGYTSLHYVNPKYHAFGVSKSKENFTVKQDSTAIGAHGTTPGSPDYPHIGIVQSLVDVGFYSGYSLTDDYRGGYNDFIVNQEAIDNDAYYLKYFKAYKNTLSNYEIEEYGLLTVRDLDNIVYKLTNNHLPLEDWLTGWQTINDSILGEFNIMGSFKEYLPNGYEWLYSTTYWTMSGIGRNDLERYEIFIDTLGNVCNDDYCNSAVGAGIRPVVKIPLIDVPSYTITKETNSNGTIEAVDESIFDEDITVTLKAKAGYKLKSITVKDANNQTVTVTDVSETTENGQLVYTKKFTMPASNVTLTATWEEIIYDIEKDTNDNGQIEVVPESAGGNEVLFVLKAKSGFKLKSIAILNENNEVVDYADLTEELEEGIYVYRSRFVMPNNGVTIKAVWEEIEEEPETPDEPEVVEYEIKNNITGDGKIEVASKAKKGDEVTFKLTALNGSTLTKLVLKNSTGEEIEYTNISEDKDGNTIITMNKFTMPEGIVTIDATFEVVKVPITGDNLIRYIMILVGSLIILTITKVAYKKNNKKKVLVIE